MLRVLTTSLTLALLVAPAAAFADDHGNGKSHGDHGNGESHGNKGRDHGDDNRDGDGDRHHDNGNHYGQDKHYAHNDDRDRYQGQRYAWQGSQYNAASWHNYRNYSYNHPAPGQTHYYANQYYRDGSYYQPRAVGYNERIYRGQDNRYYCRRSDGTTGLIIGGLSGGSLGAALAPGGSQTLGALVGGTLGALIGSSIDKNSVTCR